MDVSVNNYGVTCGLDESTFGMSPTRVSDIGRRLFYAASIDEAEKPFDQKPGRTWGVSVRT